MRPTAGDVTTCPCTYSQTPIPMTALDRDPVPQTQGDRDRTTGRGDVARPYAMPHHIVSAASRGTGFEFLMSEFHDNPRRTPSQSPPPPLSNAERRVARRGRRRRGHHVHPPPPSPVLHSAPHILFECPLVSEFRSHILSGQYCTISFLDFQRSGVSRPLFTT